MTQVAAYVLHTTALIDFSKGFEPSRTKILDLIDAGQQLAVCCVSVAEFFTGLEPAERPPWRQFFGTLPYWDITPEAAEQAGVWRHEYRARGIQLSTTDALVAATAWEQHAILITNNIKHYPMPEVRLLSARD
jgi:predicted nucleic acid-binding protein